MEQKPRYPPPPTQKKVNDEVARGDKRAIFRP